MRKLLWNKRWVYFYSQARNCLHQHTGRSLIQNNSPLTACICTSLCTVLIIIRKSPWLCDMSSTPRRASGPRYLAASPAAVHHYWYITAAKHKCKLKKRYAPALHISAEHIPRRTWQVTSAVTNWAPAIRRKCTKPGCWQKSRITLSNHVREGCSCETWKNKAKNKVKNLPMTETSLS